MNTYGNTIRLQHEYAEMFFEESMNPDFAELERRDKFLESIRQQCPVQIDGKDLVTHIPDIGIEALMGKN